MKKRTCIPFYGKREQRAEENARNAMRMGNLELANMFMAQVPTRIKRRAKARHRR